MHHPPSSSLRALAAALADVMRAPALLFGVYLLTLMVVTPFSVFMYGHLKSHLGASQMSETVAGGVDVDWWQEFTNRATGLASTFRPTVIGFAAPLDNLSALLDGTPQARPIAVLAVFYAIVWVFLWGGVMERFAQRRATSARRFFAACTALFARFLRLGVIAGIAYLFWFTVVHDWLFGPAYESLTRTVTTERAAFLWRVGLYAVFGIPLVFCNLILDYAKIRTVIEDRLSVVGALSAGFRFIRRNPLAAGALYLLNSTLFVVVLAGYWAVAPGVGGAGLGVLRAFVIGQAYILARLIVRLTFAASQIRLFLS